MTKTKHEAGLEAAYKAMAGFLFSNQDDNEGKAPVALMALEKAITAYLSATATPDKQVDDLVELVRDAIAANDCRIIDSANAVLEVLRPYLKEQTTNQRNAL